MEPPECPVCLQPFTPTSTIPRVLACGHSICESCLVSLPKPPYSCTIRCPACTQLVTFPHPQGPSALPKNIDLLRFSDPDPKPKPIPIPETKTQVLSSFMPSLWSREFFSRWKGWVLPQESVLIEAGVGSETPAGAKRSEKVQESVSVEAGVDSKTPVGFSMECLAKGSGKVQESVLVGVGVDLKASEACSMERLVERGEKVQESVPIEAGVDLKACSMERLAERSEKVQESVTVEAGVDLKTPAMMKCLVKGNGKGKVSGFKVGSYKGSDGDKLSYGYVAKALWVLFGLGEGVLGEVELVLRASVTEYRICSGLGLWYDDEGGDLYLVCERKEGSLLNVVDSDVGVDVCSFGMIGMEVCETVSRLHDVELVSGCVSLSCFDVDDFGHVFVDLNEVLMVGGRVRKICEEAVSFTRNVISEIDAFPSPEVLLEFVKKEGVDLELTCVVGYSSDLWSLACILLTILLGKPFVETTNDFLCSYILKLVYGNGCDCEGLHAAWLDKVSSLLDSRLDSEYLVIKELLCKCLSHDPGARPLVGDVWKCMRELIISRKFDVITSTIRKTTSGSTCHCLLLGDLLWLSIEANKIDDKKCEMENLKDESLVGGGDIIEAVCKKSLVSTDLKGHLGCISGLAIGGGFLFSSSFDKTISVWSLQGLNRVHTFKGHEHKVMALVFVEGEVPLCISGDNGGDIFIWGIKLPLEEKPIKKLNEEKDWRYSGIHALTAVSGSDFFYTGSGDKSVKAWSMHDHSLAYTMNGHKSVVCTLAVCNGVLYSGSWDGTIRLWSLSDHRLLAVLGEEAPSGSVLSLAAHTNTLVAAHENGCIKIWNKDVPLKPISAHNSSIFSIYMEGQWLFSGGWNKTVVVQKLSSGDDEAQVDVTEIGSIPGDSVVTALNYWQGRLFVGHADGTVKVYCYGG